MDNHLFFLWSDDTITIACILANLSTPIHYVHKQKNLLGIGNIKEAKEKKTNKWIIMETKKYSHISFFIVTWSHRIFL